MIETQKCIERPLINGQEHTYFPICYQCNRVETTVQVTRGRQSWGNDTFIPANDLAHLCADLAAAYTITPRMIEVLKTHGYTVEVIAETETL